MGSAMFFAKLCLSSYKSKMHKCLFPEGMHLNVKMRGVRMRGRQCLSAVAALELWEVMHKSTVQLNSGRCTNRSNSLHKTTLDAFLTRQTQPGIDTSGSLVTELNVPVTWCFHCQFQWGQQCQHLTNWNLFTKNLSSKMSTYCVMPLQLNWGTHWPTSFRIIRSGFLWLSIAMGLLVCAWQCVRGAIPYHF